MNWRRAVIPALLFASLACSSGAPQRSAAELIPASEAALAQVEKGRVSVTYAAGPDCPREAIAAIATLRPVVTLAQLPALASSGTSAHFVVTSFRISTVNPEWAWFEGRFVEGYGLSFGLSRAPEGVWQVGIVSICHHC